MTVPVKVPVTIPVVSATQQPLPDIILIDGNPLEDIHTLTRDNVDFVMKDGLVHKNWLPDENAPQFIPAGPERDAYLGNL